jgi:hypothetical protein
MEGRLLTSKKQVYLISDSILQVEYETDLCDTIATVPHIETVVRNEKSTVSLVNHPFKMKILVVDVVTFPMAMALFLLFQKVLWITYTHRKFVSSM